MDRRLTQKGGEEATVTRPGTVSLVGAGPGDAGLITVRGLDRLRAADVVVYDRLVSPALLGEPRPAAERICVGKAPGRKRLEQGEIEALLIQRARAGKSVVRLKGGDPFVFGRGAEEALALKEAGIPFEVVPGITSAIAVPAAAGIPVTHRGTSGAFAVWTAHRSAGAPIEAVDAPTQVILMGTSTLEETVERLLAMGRPPTTPAAVVSWGATARQRTVTGTLTDIAERVCAAGLPAPATVVVGDVVNVGLQLAQGPGPDALHNLDPATGSVDDPWARHFRGKRVALTRKSEPDRLRERLEGAGAEVAPLPLLACERGPSGASRESAPVIRCLVDMIDEGMIDAIVFESRRSRDAVFAFLKEPSRVDIERVIGFPTFIAEGDEMAPIPLGGFLETAACH